jgi:hypothetical protein
MNGISKALTAKLPRGRTFSSSCPRPPRPITTSSSRASETLFEREKAVGRRHRLGIEGGKDNALAQSCEFHLEDVAVGETLLGLSKQQRGEGNVRSFGVRGSGASYSYNRISTGSLEMRDESLHRFRC